MLQEVAKLLKNRLLDALRAATARQEEAQQLRTQLRDAQHALEVVHIGFLLSEIHSRPVM